MSREPRPVNAVQYRAADGSLHFTAEGAKERNQYRAMIAQEEAVAMAIEQPFDKYFGRDYIRRWKDMESGERFTVVSRLAAFLIENLDAINAAAQAHK